MENDIIKWVMLRDGLVTNIFQNRKDAIKHFKEMLNQTLKDLNNQDKVDEYDYSIEIPKIQILSVQERKSYLGL